MASSGVEVDIHVGGGNSVALGGDAVLHGAEHAHVDERDQDVLGGWQILGNNQDYRLAFLWYPFRLLLRRYVVIQTGLANIREIIKL